MVEFVCGFAMPMIAAQSRRMVGKGLIAGCCLPGSAADLDLCPRPMDFVMVSVLACAPMQRSECTAFVAAKICRLEHL
jgi:hypothetical protein